jgi:hypothetical protein
VEAAAVTSLLGAADLVDPVAGVVATVCVASGVAVRLASASVIAAATSSSATVVGGTTATVASATAATVPVGGFGIEYNKINTIRLPRFGRGNIKSLTAEPLKLISTFSLFLR